MARDPNYRFFYAVSRAMREQLPCALPVRIVLKKDCPEHGTCQFNPDSKPCPTYTIHIAKTGDEERDLHVLLHEYAHVLAWWCDDEDHGKAWEVAYGRVYRWYEKQILEEDDRGKE